MATIAPTKPPAAKPALVAFPAADVKACLLAELTEVAQSEALVRGISLPSDPAQLVAAPVRMDSLSVVDTLCAVEPVLGFELRDSIVRTGGYSSIEAALEHLMPRIESAWTRKNGAKS